SLTARKNRSVGSFSPVQQIVGVGKAHLVGLVRGCAKPVHPIMAVDFFGDDGPGLGPTDVPLAFVGGEDDTPAPPMREVGGSREAELCIFLVVPGVGEVVGAVDKHEARVFDTAVFFVIVFGVEDGFWPAGEVNAIGALRVAEAGGTRAILSAVEHHKCSARKILGIFAGNKNDRGIEGTGGFPGGASRRENRRAGEAAPFAEGLTGWGGREGKGGNKQEGR